MAVFLRINFTVFVVAVPENLDLRGCSEYCAKVGEYQNLIINSNITHGILSHDEPYTSSYIGSRTSLCNASCNSNCEFKILVIKQNIFPFFSYQLFQYFGPCNMACIQFHTFRRTL